jgi:peptidoglycan/LPS O-acetylase OafA/YrhL
VTASAPIGESTAVRSAGTGALERSLRLDAVRGIAAFMVVCAHAELLTGQTTTSTDGTITGRFVVVLSAGIFLFFALSGYLIAGPYLRALADGRRLPDTRGYALRRAARILPPYWVALAVILLLVPPAPHVGLRTTLIHALLLQNVFPGQATYIYFVAWTLGIEALFYVLVPVAAAVIARLHRGRPVPLGRLAAIVLGTWAASAAFSTVAAWAMPTPGTLTGPLRIGLPAMLGQFCPGMLLVLAMHAESRAAPGRLLGAYRTLRARPRLLLLAMVALTVLAQLESTLSSAPLADLHRTVFALAAGAVLVLVVNGPAWVDRAAALLAGLGTVSYGVYLWHWVFVLLLRRHHLQPAVGPGLGALAKDLVALVVITVATATASWLLVERPVIRWAKRRGSEPYVLRSASGVGEGAAATPAAAAAAASGSTLGT